jgi:predicted permease
MLGVQGVLDPARPGHVPWLGWLEGTLAWLARCAVPASLFALGLWSATRLHGEAEGAAEGSKEGAPGQAGAHSGARPRRWWLAAAVYLAVKLLLLPPLMVFVNVLLGLDGWLARALVVLTCVPVGQMAWVVAEQYGQGPEAVAAVMQAGLLLLLPHAMGTLMLLRRMGLYEQEAVG